jgi:hypothetical protein
MIYITSATTYTIGRTYGIRIEINAALTGTLTVADGDGTKAVIAIGSTAAKIYYGFNGVVTVTNSASENVTVSLLNHQG